MPPDKEYEFTTEDFDFLRGIVTKTTGIVAQDDKYIIKPADEVSPLQHIPERILYYAFKHQ